MCVTNKPNLLISTKLIKMKLYSVHFTVTLQMICKMILPMLESTAENITGLPVTGNSEVRGTRR